MKKIFILGFVLGILSSLNSQVSYTWTSSGSNSSSITTNWTPNGNPGPTDDLIFNGSSVVNCNLDDPLGNGNIDVNSIVITSAYTGTINSQANNVTIESSFNQTGGTFIASSTNMDIGGALFSSTGGSFLHNNGGVTFYPNTASTFSIIGSITFNNLNIARSGLAGTTERFMNFGTCTASNLNLNSNGFTTTPFSYLGSINILSSLTLNGTSTTNLTSNTGTFTFSGAGPITITGAGAAARSKLPNIVFNTSGTVTMTGHLSVSGNWTATQGTVAVSTSTVDMYGTSAIVSGTAAAFNNLTIQTGAVVSLPASEVKLTGTLTRTGTLNFQTGTILGLNGTGAQSIAGSAITVSAIHTYSGSRTVTMSAPVTILDYLQVDANVTFAAGGNLTLNSTNALSARVASLGTGASITGNVTVKTVIPGGATGWANLGVPGVTGQTVGSWDTYVSSGGATGIPMTCSLCSYPPSAAGSWFDSIQTWDEPTSSYDSITVNTALTPGEGFWVYVGNGGNTTTDLMLVNTGNLVQGTVSYPTTASGTGSVVNGNQVYYNLVANPYPSPISWNSVWTNNSSFFNNAIYAWSADLGPTSCVGGMADNGNSGINDNVPAGQAFYVENSIGVGVNLDFHESDKLTTSGTYQLVRPTAPDVGQYFRLRLQGTADKSETVMRFHAGATPYYDKAWDSHKMFVSPGYVGYPGSYSKYTSLSTKGIDGTDYAIQSLAPLTESVSIPLLAKVSGSGTFTLSAYDFNSFNSCVMVYDHMTSTYHDLRQSDYVVVLSDTLTAPRFDLVLCRDASANPTGVAEIKAGSGAILINQDPQGAYVKTAFPQNAKGTISVYNILGQKLMNDIAIEGTTTYTHLNLDVHNQVVLIQVNTDQGSSTKRIVMQ